MILANSAKDNPEDFVKSRRICKYCYDTLRQVDGCWYCDNCGSSSG